MADAHHDAAGTPGDLDPDAPPTDEELREASALAAALEAGSAAPHDDAMFLRSLVHAHAPERSPLDAERNERLVARALDKGKIKGNGRVIRVLFGGGAVTAALAAAAAVVLFFGNGQVESAPKLAQSRSTQELFHEPFQRGGGEAAARIDRIAMARSSDLRENRFTRWGVR